MKKLKLKEDEDGNKTSTVNGIRAKCKVMKTRYAKPFEDVEIKIPYTTGMDPYSGLIDLFEKQELLVKSGNRLKYVSPQGKEYLEYRKAWTGELLDMIMRDIIENPQLIINSTEADEETADNKGFETDERNTDS
jgi:hypothetical protein